MKKYTEKLPRGAAVLFTAVLTLLSGILFFQGCTTTGASTDEEVLYLNLMWHQHQPMYYQDPETGVYSRPWARVHGTKDYLDMAEMLEEYPEVKATFNLTPVLLRQITDLAEGVKDRYWVLAEKDASELSEAERRFILARFFDANYTNMIGRFPRYRQLLDKRGAEDPSHIDAAMESFTVQDLRDLQIWFNLAWIDPAYLAEEPLAGLVRKGRDFTESDKTVLFSEVRGILEQIIPLHRRLQDAGQIRVTTTPYAHPILPLVYTTKLARKGDPSVELPEWFSYPNDAIIHLQRSVDLYRELFGREPEGLWPAEGAVGQEMVRLVSNAGFQWMASGEQVLAKSLDIGDFTRGADDTVEQADALYRPYYATTKDGEKVAVVFRDLRLSDLIGFEYSGTPGEKAAADFMDRLERIRLQLKKSGASGPHLVSVILDGENAWEHYPNDGKEFLSALYRNLSESRSIRTITPGEYLQKFPDQRELDTLFWGAWFSPDYATWIGEEEENIAWNYLGRTRRFLAEYDMYGRKSASPEQLASALDAMYLAEGSDWFWWYGSDQDSGNDRYFDHAFRTLLGRVYTSLGEKVPEYVKVPIIPDAPVSPVSAPEGAVSVRVDGKAGDGEWAKAGRFQVSGGAMARAGDEVTGLRYGFSTEMFSLLLHARSDWMAASGRELTVYLSHPRQEQASPTGLDGDVLGFRAGYALTLSPREDETGLFIPGRTGEWQKVQAELNAAAAGRTLEVALPLELFPDIRTGDMLQMKVFLGDSSGRLQALPRSGPLLLSVPRILAQEAFLEIQDPEGDDHGPGSYTYPLDPVFNDGGYDITSFTASTAGDDLSFTFALRGEIHNPWNSGIGLSVQTFDIYIDTDPGAGTGARMLLEGRGAAVPQDSGWEYAIWVEGWNQKVLVPNDQAKPVEIPVRPRVLVDPALHEVTVLVPASAISAKRPPEEWAFLAVVLSQEGFPSPGVRRVRDVQPQASQWRLGGGSGAVNGTRIIDMAWNGRPSQEDFLQDAPEIRETPRSDLVTDDFAVVPLTPASDT